MTFRDLFFSLAAAFLIALFLLPTLINTGLYSRLPISPILLFALLPIAATLGMVSASFLGRKIRILWQFAKFGLVGVLNTSIDFGVLNLLIAMMGVTSGVGIILINATSFSTAVGNSYFWNKDWVFPEGKKANFVTFVVVTLIGLSINTLIVYGLTTYVSPILVGSDKLWANFAKVLATLLSLIWNFTGYKLIVFKK